MSRLYVDSHQLVLKLAHFSNNGHRGLCHFSCNVLWQKRLLARHHEIASILYERAWAALMVVDIQGQHCFFVRCNSPSLVAVLHIM